MFCMDEPDRHPGLPRAERPHARASRQRSDGRLIPFVRLDLGEEPDRGGDALPRPRRARDQAPPARAALPAERRAARAGLRARRRAARADPDPRRPRAAADRRPPRAARRQLPRRAADHRPRRDRRPGRAGRPLRRQGRRLLRHLGLEPDRPARHVPPRLAGAGPVRLRLPVRPAAELAADRAPTARLAGFDEDEVRDMLGGQREPDRRRRAAARADPAARRRDVLASRWSSRASTSTCRWRRRSSGRASPTRSACSGSR